MSIYPTGNGVIANEWMPILAAAEKLAEALEFVTMPITAESVTLDSLKETMANDYDVASKALAEYREKFPKDKK